MTGDATGKWFRVRLSDGFIVGVATMPWALALANLSPGEALAPFDAAINPRRVRWDGSGWAERAPEPRLEDDPRFMRRTGYPAAGEQLGLLMKLTRALLDLPALAEAVPNAVRTEAEALLADIEAVKANHPIESDTP